MMEYTETTIYLRLGFIYGINVPITTIDTIANRCIHSSQIARTVSGTSGKNRQSSCSCVVDVRDRHTRFFCVFSVKLYFIPRCFVQYWSRWSSLPARAWEFGVQPLYAAENLRCYLPGAAK